MREKTLAIVKGRVCQLFSSLVCYGRILERGGALWMTEGLEEEEEEAIEGGRKDEVRERSLVFHSVLTRCGAAAVVVAAARWTLFPR